MILKGSQRGGGRALALHLLNAHDNDHVTVHQLRVFLSDDLAEAFAEIEAVASGTRCVQPYFSVSINTPAEGSANLTDKDFRAATHRIELANGLRGHPRAIVFHEKDGRRHAHIVWSRIDAQTMTAKNLSHFKRKLMGVSKELFLEHGFDLPDGFKDPQQASPDRATLAEWQAAKRRGRNAIDQKQLIRQCWEASDGKAGFAAAVAEHGYALARGDRRGHVVVTADRQIIAVARAVGAKTKEVRAKLGEADDLPGVATAQAELAGNVSARFVRAAKEVRAGLSAERQKLDVERAAQIKAHRAARSSTKAQQEQRRAKTRAQLQTSRRGLSGIWDRLVHHKQRHIERAALEEHLKSEDQAEWQELRRTQLAERHALEDKRRALRREAFGLVDDIRVERDALIAQITGDALPSNVDLRAGFADAIHPDPRQVYIAQENPGPVTDAQIRAAPERLLERLSYFDAAFSERDISRALIKIMPDTMQAMTAKRQILTSEELMRIDGTPPHYTTRAYVQADTRLQSTSRALLGERMKAPSRRDTQNAIRTQSRALFAEHGTRLSEEQINAITQMVTPSRLSMVVGRAGTGKSTILAAANDAWERAGIRVHGAALAGKAAAGLEDASGIASRTLASLEMSWANGNAPLKQGDVLVIDEAGMIGTRQLERIAAKINDTGAKLVLVGDPDQLPPIEAGQPFRGLVDRHGACHLTEIHRQNTNWQKQATTDLAEGRIAQAVARYQMQGCVTPAPTIERAITQLTEDYLSARANDPDASRLILAHRRRDVHNLNQSVRETLKLAGELPEGVLLKTDQGPREITQGDRIVFTANDRETRVKNGMLGTVRAATETHVTVDLDDGRRIRFNPTTFRSFDHGYAVTIHKSQGVTVDKAFVLASRSMDDPLAYVALSRHREDMRLYVSAQDRPTWAHGPQPAPGRTIERGWSLGL